MLACQLHAGIIFYCFPRSLRLGSVNMYPQSSRQFENNLVLLHGMFGKPAQWRGCADHFRDAWQVLCPELPVMDVEPDARAICVLADEMVLRMDAAGMARAVIGGNSLGGHIAMRMALSHPDRVSGLILTGSSGLLERGFEKSVPRRPTEHWIRTKMHGIFHHPVHVTDELVAEMRAFLNNIRRVIHMIRIAKCAKRDNLGEVLSSITCPVLLIWGENDEVTPPEAACEFHERLPLSRLHLIAECGHVPMVEQPAVFNELAACFLDELSGGPGSGPSREVPFSSLHITATA